VVIDGVAVPVGDEADDATAAAIEATVRAVFACFNAGDFLRATGLFTDDLTSEIFRGSEFSRGGRGVSVRAAGACASG
jgi:hypothetical protein